MHVAVVQMTMHDQKQACMIITRYQKRGLLCVTGFTVMLSVTIVGTEA